MAKKAARKTTKKVTKSVMASKPMTKKDENYLPLLLIILAASLFFFWLVISMQPTSVPSAVLKSPTPTTIKVTPKTVNK